MDVMDGGDRRTDHRRIDVVVEGQQVDPLVDADLVIADLGEDSARCRAHRHRHEHTCVREHVLLVGEIDQRIGFDLTPDQLLDRERTAIGVEPPHPTLLAASRNRQRRDRRAEVVGRRDQLSVVSKHVLDEVPLSRSDQRCRCRAAWRRARAAPPS